MTEVDQKAVLLRYLDAAREGLLWKLEGLSDYDIRRPLTRTGTNLLGIVKHVAMVESGYLGSCFARPVSDPVPHFDPVEMNSDMWATADESRDFIVDFYQRVAENSAATVDALDLEARGEVRHWPKDRRHPTLQELLVRMVGETNRHAGHADIVRESIDGAAGLRPAVTNLPDEGDEWWAAYRAKLEGVASIRHRLSHGYVEEPPPVFVRDLVPYAHARDMAQSLAFYAVLGFDIVTTIGGADQNLWWAFLQADRARLMLAAASEPIQADAQAILLYLYTDDLPALRRRLLDEEIEPSVISHPAHMPAGEMRLHDPDGYVLLVGQRRPKP